MENKKTTIKVKDTNKLDDLVNKYKGKDIDIELIDEKKEINPWAICNASVGNKDKAKFEACVKKVKEENNLDESVTDDVLNLIDLIKSKLAIHLKKINTPAEKAKLIITFAELLQVPKNKIGEIVSSIKDIGVNPTQMPSMNERKTIKIKESELKALFLKKISENYGEDNR